MKLFLILTFLLASSMAIAADTGKIELIAVSNAQEAVKKRLRDPGSASFRNVAVYRPGNGVTVCGEVNAKNGFGGYTGHEPFVWIPLGPDMRPDVKNGMAFVGAQQIGDKGALCRNVAR